MSLIWFMILFWVYRQGMEINDNAYIMFCLLYIGDCILAKRK